MKKTLLILLVSFLSFQGYAQDPDLFRTWYLHQVHMDFDEPYEISNINPPIQPFLTIEEDFSFSGEGACNTFIGVYDISSYDIYTISYNATNDDCGIQVHNSFENDYFSLISEGFMYVISQESDGLTLYVDTPLMSGLIFKEYPLSVSDLELSKVTIYPNPASEKLFISSENNNINTVSIFSALGKRIKKITASSITSIDVSNLSKGIYFIEIATSEGKTVKRFIKN